MSRIAKRNIFNLFEYELVLLNTCAYLTTSSQLHVCENCVFTGLKIVRNSKNEFFFIVLNFFIPLSCHVVSR